MLSSTFDFADMYDANTLASLDAQFVAWLLQDNPLLHSQLLAYRSGEDLGPHLSAFLLALAIPIEQAIAYYFDIESESIALCATATASDPIFQFKKLFVVRLAKRKMKQQPDMPPFQILDDWLNQALLLQGCTLGDRELDVANLGAIYLSDPDHYADEMVRLTDWTVQAMMTPEGQAATGHWVSLALPKKCNPFDLVSTQPFTEDNETRGSLHLRQREGFSLTDEGMSLRQIQNEVHYCVYCHDKEGDFCRTGFPVKKKLPELGLKLDAFDQPQTGCPLDERISEMHVLQRDGYVIGALAMIMRDNPMCPATGHRICNDCMKACIYQKQDPVNIPQIESGVLSEVLKLPWGVEIFNLLLRWNPLRPGQSILKAYNGRKVAVMGMGPAGFSLAYHLLMEGCAVVGLDGLKVEPLPDCLLTKPIENYQSLVEDLDKRITWGFGGVAEYGITVRWDKNFLTLLYLSLCRFNHFQVFGSVRFGGTFQVEDAWRLGFDHLAIAVGAGLPKELPIPGSLAIGMRQANDFLMALQLTGAAKSSHMANLQVRLPALVIGGGLTAVDTATEIQAYYLRQIEKVMQRHESLEISLGKDVLQSHFQGSDSDVLAQWLAHAGELREEREQAKKEGRQPDLISLLRRWGGVTIVYRRSMQESPAYKRNHEELTLALEEGIGYLAYHEPLAALCDSKGHIAALQCRKRQSDPALNTVNDAWDDHPVDLAARSVFVATGAKPNVAYGFEHPGTFARNRYEYQGYQDQQGALVPMPVSEHCKSSFGPFTSYDKADKRVSFLGDTHPLFHGSVVKAIASAKYTYPDIMGVLPRSASQGEAYQTFSKAMQSYFTTTVISRRSLGDAFVELVVQAPAAAYHYEPGHLYRLQPWESKAKWSDGTCLFGESVALIGTKVSQEDGTVTLVLPQDNVNGRLAGMLQPNDFVSLMGPTGVRMKVPEGGESIVMLGGAMTLALAVAYGQAARMAGNRFYLIVKLSGAEEGYYLDELALCTDGIMLLSSEDQLDGVLPWLSDQCALDGITRVITHGGAATVKSWRAWISKTLKSSLTQDVTWIASVYGPMQCMMKGVCAQCLQWQVDPATGERTKAVYTCSWQDQPMAMVDWQNLDERVSQNQTQAILSSLWLDHVFESLP